MDKVSTEMVLKDDYFDTGVWPCTSPWEFLRIVITKRLGGFVREVNEIPWGSKVRVTVEIIPPTPSELAETVLKNSQAKDIQFLDRSRFHDALKKILYLPTLYLSPLILGGYFRNGLFLPITVDDDESTITQKLQILLSPTPES
jgi:hypothetical protein